MKHFIQQQKLGIEPNDKVPIESP